MTTDSLTPPDLGEAIRDAWMHAIFGQNDDLIERLADIAGWGVPGVHTAVWGWSAASLMCLTGDERPDRSGFYTLQVTDATTGEAVSIDQLSRGRPSDRQAVQMVTLYGNGDFDTAVAIVEVACKRDAGAALLMSSVQIAAALTRAHMEQHEQGGCTGCGEAGEPQ